MANKYNPMRAAALTAGLAAFLGGYAQVSIRNGGVAPPAPDSRSVLDVNWTAGQTVMGLLAPRMTAAQRTGISLTPANSLLVYQTDVNSPHGYWFYDAALPTPAWVRVGQGTPWVLGGNAGTNVALDYIGTNNAQALRINTNNNATPRMVVNAGGQVGVNLATVPTEQMELNGALRLVGTSNVTPSPGSIRFNSTSGAHDGNIDGTANWYQLENIFGSRVKQNYLTQPTIACTYPSSPTNPITGPFPWPNMDTTHIYPFTTSQSTLEVPYSIFWEEGRHQYMYLAQDLANTNICPGTNITGIAFKVTALSAGTSHVKYAKIRMKNTTTANTNTFDDAALNLFADYGATITPVTTGWNIHNFTASPFQWTGVPFNMLVDFAFDNQDWTSVAYNPIVEFETTPFNSTFGQYCDACGSLFVGGTCFYTSTAGVTCAMTPQPTGPAAAGPLVTCWGHTGGSAPQSWSPAPMFTTTTNLVTCDGTFTYVGTNTAVSRRPVLRLYAQASATAPILKRGTYLFAQEGVTIGTPGWATSGAYPNQVFRGPGTIAAQVGVWGGGVLLSDHVFDKYYDGATRPEDAQQAASYEHYPVDGMMNYLDTYRHLPTIDGRERWSQNGPFSTDQLTNQLWVTVEDQSLYIKELNERMNALQQFLVEKRLKELKGK